MLGRLAVPNIIYVRPVGGPENTSNIGENPNINNLTWPLDPHPNSPAEFFAQKSFMACDPKCLLQGGRNLEVAESVSERGARGVLVYVDQKPVALVQKRVALVQNRV